MNSGVKVNDGGFAEITGWGSRRLKVLLELSRHPELDLEDWTGQVQFHFGKGSNVKGAVWPAPQEIAA